MLLFLFHLSLNASAGRTFLLGWGGGGVICVFWLEITHGLNENHPVKHSQSEIRIRDQRFHPRLAGVSVGAAETKLDGAQWLPSGGEGRSEARSTCCSGALLYTSDQGPLLSPRRFNLRGRRRSLETERVLCDWANTRGTAAWRHADRENPVYIRSELAPGASASEPRRGDGDAGRQESAGGRLSQSDGRTQEESGGRCLRLFRVNLFIKAGL